MTERELIELAESRGGKVTGVNLPGAPADLPKPSKYRNVKVTLDGYTFDSKKEAKRYGELKALERNGDISNLTVHPRYTIQIRERGQWYLICIYEADFCYFTAQSDLVVEDCKGVKTPVYKLKKKLMKAVHNIDVVEI